MQRHLALAGPLDARDFRAVDSAACVDLDAVDAHVHRDLHRALHGALEGDTALELLGDALGHELRVRVGSLDFLDLDVDFLLGHLLELGADRLDVTALVADDHARDAR